MARYYSTKSFFRNAPNKLFGRYFKDRQLLYDLDFTSMKEGNPETLFAAWLELPDEYKKNIDADFQEIFALSCEKGIKDIIDEARHHIPDNLNEFTGWLASKKNHYEKAFSTFLDHPTFWKGAALFFHADSLSYWRKRKNIPSKPALCEESHLKQLSNLIADYLYISYFIEMFP